MGLKKFGSRFGSLVGGLGVMISAKAIADPNHGPEQDPKINPALDRAELTYEGVQDCGVYLRPIILGSQDTDNPITRSESAHMLADCRNAQLQAERDELDAIIKEQEATLAEQEATLADLDAQLASKGLKVEGGQLFDLDGRLLGNFIREEGQPVRLDLTPFDELNEKLAAEAAQSLADLEAFLMRSLSEELQ